MSSSELMGRRAESVATTHSDHTTEPPQVRAHATLEHCGLTCWQHQPDGAPRPKSSRRSSHELGLRACHGRHHPNDAHGDPIEIEVREDAGIVGATLEEEERQDKQR